MHILVSQHSREMIFCGADLGQYLFKWNSDKCVCEEDRFSEDLIQNWINEMKYLYKQYNITNLIEK